MIRFDNVSKHHASHRALQSVSFELDNGEMAFLTGHSGAGKSTLLKLIMMIVNFCAYTIDQMTS